MAFQQSPGIVSVEVDLTTSIGGVSTTIGGIAGVFRWGPEDELVLVSSEVELARKMGKPKTGFNSETFFVAADFLSYSDALYVSRVVAANSAQSTVATAVAAYDTSANTDYANTAVDELRAKYYGEMGNSLKFVAISANSYANSAFSGNFGSAPANTSFVHMLVIDEDGLFTGTANTILEKYEGVSMANGAFTADGTNNFLDEVLAQQSAYIEVPTGSSFSADLMTFLTTEDVDFAMSLASGADGDNEATISMAELQAGYDLFKSEEVDVSLIMAGKARGVVGNHYSDLAEYIIQNVCEYRKDAICLFSPDKNDVVNNGSGTEVTDVSAFRDAMSSSSYGFMDSGYKYRYDKYNDVYVWVPLNGDIAGICARTDVLKDPWWSPGGYQRGILKNVVKLAWNPNKTQRDALYPKGINPVINEKGFGTILLGDRTTMAINSAFDRINVRRLFIVLRKGIGRAAKTTLFEFNDEFTRAGFVNKVAPYLRDIQGRRGIYDQLVVCDERNNTAEVIDRNEFVGDIYVKPAKSINFIQLNFIATRTGVDFAEIVGNRG